jgi:hypothetical protein
LIQCIRIYSYQEQFDKEGRRGKHLYVDCHSQLSMLKPANVHLSLHRERTEAMVDMAGKQWDSSLSSLASRIHIPGYDLYDMEIPESMHSWICSSLKYHINKAKL